MAMKIQWKCSESNLFQVIISSVSQVICKKKNDVNSYAETITSEWVPGNKNEGNANVLQTADLPLPHRDSEEYNNCGNSLETINGNKGLKANNYRNAHIDQFNENFHDNKVLEEDNGKHGEPDQNTRDLQNMEEGDERVKPPITEECSVGQKEESKITVSKSSSLTQFYGLNFSMR